MSWPTRTASNERPEEAWLFAGGYATTQKSGFAYNGCMPPHTLLLIPLLLVAGTGLAHADHTETSRITDDSPYTLRPGEHKIGLASIEYGLLGHPLLRKIEVGTNPWLWLTNAAGLRSYNVRGKYEFYSDEHLALSIRSSFYQIGRGGNRVRLVPLEVYSGVRIAPRWTVGAGYRRTKLSVRGGVGLTEDVEAVGEVGFSTSQFRAMGEYRLSSFTAFVSRGSIQRYQQVRAEASAGTEMTMGGVFADINLLPAETAYNISGAVAWSWDRMNIELGLQYGNPTIPGIDAVMPFRTVMPVVDLYWRF